MLGPFVRFHHQGLLIPALWPEGRGNIAFGANVGSNHTGKKPDQEIRPGEGNFFGLGCSINFPANYEDSRESHALGSVATPVAVRDAAPSGLFVPIQWLEAAREAKGLCRASNFPRSTRSPTCA